MLRNPLSRIFAPNGKTTSPDLGRGLPSAALGIALLCLTTYLQAEAAGASTIQFSRDILPILSDNCYQCHGPDEESRKAKLRFDTKEGAFRIKDGKPVIVPGHSADSEFIRRINSKDPEDLMPPPKSNHKLTPAQINLLTRWVDEGAEWSRHWAFVAPQRANPPGTKNKRWTRNAIDQYVLAKLEKEGLHPAPEARKDLLIRRVTFALTGLPPTLAEIDAFLNDTSANAYEKVVDRLLASPEYGERMATDWLDIARYADTHGYQMDRYRPMWPWRDWVIRSFNANLPFDQFITWQLAGDLLPHPTKEQKLATAFNRLHMQNEEGGIVEEEYRVSYIVDRVDTMGTAFLGLTFECSRCHDHKFDPITQRDFYSLFAFFQNIDESGQTDYFNGAMPVPTLMLTDSAIDDKISSARRRIQDVLKEESGLRDQAKGDFEKWLAAKPTLSRKPPGLAGSFDFESIVSNKLANLAEASKPAHAQENPILVPGHSGNCAQLTGDNGFTFPNLGHFTRVDPFSFGIWLRTPTNAPRFVVFHQSKAPIDAGSRGYELLLEDGRPAFGLHHTWPENSLKVIGKQSVTPGEWTQITVTYDGSGRAAGVHLYINGNQIPVDIVRDGLKKDITYGGGEPDLAIGYRFRDNGFKDGCVDDFEVFNRALTRLEAAQLAGKPDLAEAWNASSSQLNDNQRDGLFDYYLANTSEPAKAWREELRKARREEMDIVNPLPEVMVMREMAGPRPAYVLKRGAYDAHGEEVFANTPAALPPFPANEPRNRLGLAYWLVARDNPLTSRVIVNRAWQTMFGRGIVETSDNFGRQGSFPTHPELLDWLAIEFMDSGWDFKHLLKLMAMSATFRQSSRAAPELLARDPSNELLARGPAHRLSAEMLRDQALADGGLLVEKIGGPTVKPYQPEGLWEEKAMGAPKYDQGKGDDLHRRSLYTFWKRTVPPPAMIAFDAAERNICCARRQTTSTPLQSLVLLNDTQIIEAARRLSERMLVEGGKTLDEQVAWAFRVVTSRKPTGAETILLKELYGEQRKLFAADGQAVKKLLAVGEAPSSPALSQVDLAAGTVLAEAILNHDGAVMSR